MSLPRPTPTRPAGRVSPDQLDNDLQTEQDAWDNLSAVEGEFATQQKVVDAAATELTGLIDDLTGTLLPNQAKSVSALTASIAAAADSRTILQNWRQAVSDTRNVLLQIGGITSQLSDLDDALEGLSNSEQDVRSANNSILAAANQVNADLLNLNITPAPAP